MIQKANMSCEEFLMKLKVLISLVTLVVFASPVIAQDRLVPVPYGDIQSAIDAAVSGEDEVIVSDDTYSGVGNRGLDFQGKSITVRSENGPANCIIDCGGLGQAFYFHSQETNDAVVQGFTITGGIADFGGAIECFDSSPTISDCIIFGNRANYYGGAIECYEASPEIFNCLFYNNQAIGSGGTIGYGGAIDCEDASPMITNCTFSDNTAGNGGGIFSSWNSQPQVVNCIFEGCNNHAIHEYAGGGTFDNDVTVMNCLFHNNYPGDYYDADTLGTYTGGDSINGIPDGYADHDNIDGDPMFREGPLGHYYLSQVDAGQIDDSKCVGAGTVAADNIALFSTQNVNYTTRTDNGANTGDTGEDEDIVDLGYHYTNGDHVGSYQLTPVVDGGHGSMELDPCLPSRIYVQYAEVALTAAPDVGYKVREWTGGTKYDGFFPANVAYPLGRAENIVTMTQNKTVTVEFEIRNEHLLTTEVVGGNGMLFPASGLQYEWDIVKLTAEPDEGYQVEVWTGTDDDDLIEDGGDPNVYNYVTMDSAKHVTVEFIAGSKLLEAIVIDGNGTVHPRIVRDYVHSYVELTAYPDHGYRVKAGSWTQTPPPWPTDPYNNPAEDHYVAVLHDDTIVTVEFEPQPWYWLYTQVTLGSDGWAHGWIDPNGPQMDEEPVNLIASPAPGYEVQSWTGTDDDSSTSLTNTITINGPYDDYPYGPIVSVKFKPISQIIPDPCDLDPCDIAWVYPAAPDGEPVWAAIPVGYHTIQEAIDDPCTFSGIYGPWVVEGDPDATPAPIPEVPETPGDIVVVKDGTHRGDGNRDLDFKGKMITVRSEFGPENCIIDCEGAGQGFVLSMWENHGCVVDGFTFKNGYADYGGGMSITGISSPLINNCIIENNTAVLAGGGLYFEGLAEDDTTYTDLAAEADAMAVEVEEALAAVGLPDPCDPCAISEEEYLELLGAAGLARAVAIVAQQIVDSIGADDADRPTLTDCKILENNVGDMIPGDGGGIYCLNSAPIILGTEISRNTAGPGTLGFGGGVYCEASPAEFINCLVTYNWSSEIGGAFYLAAGSDAIIRLSTIAYNHSDITNPDSPPDTLDGICADESNPVINNCIIYHVDGTDLYECTAEFSWVEDENEYQLPGWVDGPLGPYYLSQTPPQEVDSPCFNAGEMGVLQELQNPPTEEDGYGLPLQLTTSVTNAYDSTPTDQGYHYPFWTGPPVKCRLRIYVHGAGTLEYSEEEPPPIGTILSNSYAEYVCDPGTTVYLTADPCDGYRVYEWEGTDTYPSYAIANSVTVYYDSVQNLGGYKIVELWFEETFPSTIHVPGEFAYNEIQNAIDAARDGDTLVLAPGTYPGTGYLVWGKNITITAEFPTERDNPAMATIIDCTGESEGGFHLIGYERGECILNGLVIQTSTTWWIADGFDGDDIQDGIAGTPGQPGGSTNPGQLPWIFWPGGPTSIGQHYNTYFPYCGISVYGNHTVVNCTVRGFDIRGGDGGDGQAGDDDVPLGGYGGDGGSCLGVGMYIGQQYYTAILRPNRALIKDCIIEDCMVVAGDGGNGAEGGANVSDGGKGGLAGTAEGAGIYIEALTSPTFKNCIIRNNQAFGAYAGDGGDSGPFGGAGGYGGLTPYDSMQPHPSTRTSRGAGAFCQAYSRAIFTDCLFEDNFTEGSVSGIGGTWLPGGHVSQPRQNHKIPAYGSAVFCEGGSDTTFTNCIIRNNEAQYGYGAGLPTDPEGGEPRELDQTAATGYTGYGGGVCVEGAINSYGIILIGIFENIGVWDYTFASAEVPAVATFTNCQIGNNSSSIGGGIYSTKSDIDIVDCNFIDNSSYLGGGLHSTHGLTDVSRCRFQGNMASMQAGDDQLAEGVELGIGGGLFYFTTDGVISDTVITENFADVSGGGVYLAGEPNSIMRMGGATCTPQLKNCLVTDNTAGRNGAGVACNVLVKAEIANCTIADNKLTDITSYGGGLHLDYGSDVEVIDSIFWENMATYGSQIAVDGFAIDVNGVGLEYFSTLDITYSDIGTSYLIDEPVIDPCDLNGGQKAGGPLLVGAKTIYDKFDAGQGMVKVIVSLAEPVALRKATDKSSPASVAALKAEIASRQDAVLSTLALSEFNLCNLYENFTAFAGEVTESGLNKLLADPLVTSVEPDRIVYLTLAQGIPLINGMDVRSIYNGQGLAVAICDSGVDYTHPMLGGGAFPNSKVIGGYDTGENDADPMPSTEAHGTACAGLAAGDLGTVGDYIGGVAHNAKIYALKISTDLGTILESAYIAAWDWCITHQYDDPDHPIMIISNSFGGGQYFNPEEAQAAEPASAAAAERVVEEGITLLASSGNEYYTDSMGAPAAFSTVISVGAVDDVLDTVMDYSNTADFLDVLAPSEDAYTTDIVGTAGYDTGDYFPSFDGTSAACPYAAGAVACIQTAARSGLGRYLTPDEVRNILVNTGDPVTDTKVNITKPRINLGEAVNIYRSYGTIYVDDGCTLNGEVIYNFDPDTFTWTPNSNNIDQNPLFVDDYYLSQKASGQPADSPCVDAGSDSAVEIGLHVYTTRTDGAPDESIVDMGYHHPPVQIDVPSQAPCSSCDVAPLCNKDGCLRSYGNGIVNLEDFAEIGFYWLGYCSIEWWCFPFTSDYYIGFDELISLADCWLVWDDQGPEPDQSTWKVEPYSNAPTSITMTATTAVDNWGLGVEYYFDETSGGNDSTWQTSATYTDTGLSPDTQYTYRVRARDLSMYQNETAWSAESSVVTPGEDTTPPSPVGWAVPPYATGTTTIAMTALTATDPEGNGPVEYYFEETTGGPGGTDRDWGTGRSYTDAGLSPDTQYCYRVGVRDSYNPPNQNEAWSTPACATTDEEENLPPYPDGPIGGIGGPPGQPGDTPQWDPEDVGGFSGEPHEWPDGQGGYVHYMRADIAIDPEGVTPVYYYFTCVGGQIPDSGWQTINEWFPSVPAQYSPYSYTVKYGDAPDGGSVSVPCPVTPVIW